jgi:hypothetical protein
MELPELELRFEMPIYLVFYPDALRVESSRLTALPDVYYDFNA